MANSSKNIKVKDIPLKVKKAKIAKAQKSSVLSSNALPIYLIIALILINIILLANYVSTREKNSPTYDISNERIAIKASKLGSWQDQNNQLLIFAEDNNFYWYTSSTTQNDNYYQGTYNYQTGLEALKEMGYTEDEFYLTFGNDISLDNVYSINIFPSLLINNHRDLTSIKLKPNETWWYLLIIKNDDTAIGYNKTLDLRYNLTKYQSR